MGFNRMVGAEPSKAWRGEEVGAGHDCRMHCGGGFPLPELARVAGAAKAKARRGMVARHVEFSMRLSSPQPEEFEASCEPICPLVSAADRPILLTPVSIALGAVGILCLAFLLLMLTAGPLSAQEGEPEGADDTAVATPIPESDDADPEYRDG